MPQKEKSILQLKIQKKIQFILLDLFSKSEMSLGSQKFFISISNVDISPNFKNLKIFIDILNMNKADKQKVIKKLNKDDVFAIKNLLAKKINLRYVPEILFILDESSEKLYEMSKLIEKEKEKYKKINE